MKIPVELNSLLLTFFCYITWFDETQQSREKPKVGKSNKGKKLDWVNCDHCSKWAHLDCTEN